MPSKSISFLRRVLVVLAELNVLYGFGYLVEVNQVASSLSPKVASYSFYNGFMLLGLGFTQLVVGWFVAKGSDAIDIQGAKKP